MAKRIQKTRNLKLRLAREKTNAIGSKHMTAINNERREKRRSSRLA